MAGQHELVLKTALGATACVAVTKLLLYYQHHKCFPRRFRRRAFSGERPQRAKDVQVERDGYTNKKAEQIEDIDAIVIGSGLGGLTCAAMLSRAGWRCLVLEQHYIAGGCTHMFEDKGYEFDTGLHYVGNIDRRAKYLDLVCAKPLEWAQMGSKEDGFTYDEVVVGPTGCSTSVKFPAGREAFADALEKEFPGQRATVNQWLDFLTKITKTDKYMDFKLVRPRWLARLLNRLLSGEFFRCLRRGPVEALDDFTKDQKLRAVLLGQFGNYSARPGEASLYTHAAVAIHYVGGAWYPSGGSVEIARNIIPTIERTGGRVLVRKGVQSIVVEQGKACGVVMENGHEIRAPCVISACGASNTWGKLVPSDCIPPGILGKIAAVGVSATIMYCFIGLDSDQLDLPAWNIWRWPTEDDFDLDKMILKFQADPENAPVPLFCGFPSKKDPTFSQRHPGKSTAVLLTIGKYEWFAQWEGTKWGKRGTDYEDFKTMLKERIVNEGLYEMWPETKGHVEYSSLGTSLTYNHFIGSVRGECYGLDLKPERFSLDDWLRPESPVPGLYLTGQDVAMFGIAGALMSGVLTSMAVLGYGSPLDVVSGRNLVEDLWHLDAAEKSEYSAASAQHSAKAYAAA